MKNQILIVIVTIILTMIITLVITRPMSKSEALATLVDHQYQIDHNGDGTLTIIMNDYDFEYADDTFYECLSVLTPEYSVVLIHQDWIGERQ